MDTQTTAGGWLLGRSATFRGEPVVTPYVSWLLRHVIDVTAAILDGDVPLNGVGKRVPTNQDAVAWTAGHEIPFDRSEANVMAHPYNNPTSTHHVAPNYIGPDEFTTDNDIGGVQCIALHQTAGDISAQSDLSSKNCVVSERTPPDHG